MRRTVRVCHCSESIGTAVGDVSRGGGPVIAWKENQLGSGTGLANGGDDSLNGGSPSFDIRNYGDISTLAAAEGKEAHVLS